MTSGAKKEKARKKARAQKLLEEEQQRVEVETAQRASCRAWPAHPDSRPFFDTSTLIFYDDDTPQLVFPPNHPAANCHPHLQSYIYGSLDDEPPPHLLPIRGAPIRRRNHRLFPQRREQRPFPKALPKRTVISAPHADILAIIPSHPLIVSPPLPPPREDHPPGLSLRPIDILGLWPLHHDDPIHPDEVPALDIPAPLICPCPADHLVLPVPTLPAQTAYGLVRSSLAVACAGEKAVLDAVSDKFHLLELPGDQLVFLCMLAEFVVLEPVFREFLHPAIANFAHGWVTHCLQDSFG
ncbi:hypothetical protein B0H17DRAFT_1122788 [Mycena rosella]|uniref:Uncharacterized protein n=1 Tax=Mycena rosella TaxID=1033263 RepID=A0AAD7F7B6_MYCRO|nr:hypothetical protein B0H17DRAFT_1122788 [Mycena rosella]